MIVLALRDVVPSTFVALLVGACSAAGTAPTGAASSETATGTETGTVGAACTEDVACGMNAACVSYRCESGKCVQSFAAKGTSLPDTEQKDGDCKKAVCDGAGQIASTEDDGDAPKSTRECKQAVCAAGTSTEIDVPDGHACAMGAGVCTGGVCKLPQGHSCGADSECQTGFCADGVCCGSRCGGICASCALAGHIGTCSVVPPNTEDPGTCGGTHACTGSPGECLLKLGEPCASSSECITFNCGGSPKKCQ